MSDSTDVRKAPHEAAEGTVPEAGEVRKLPSVASLLGSLVLGALAIGWVALWFIDRGECEREAIVLKCQNGRLETEINLVFSAVVVIAGGLAILRSVLGLLVRLQAALSHQPTPTPASAVTNANANGTATLPPPNGQRAAGDAPMAEQPPGAPSVDVPGDSAPADAGTEDEPIGATSDEGGVVPPAPAAWSAPTLTPPRPTEPPVAPETSQPPLYRRPFVWIIAALALIAGAVILVAVASGGSSTARARPGTYTGTGDDGFSIEFTVDADGPAIAELISVVRCGSIGRSETVTLQPPMPIENGRFSLPEPATGGIGVDGRFVSDGTRARGDWTSGDCSGSWSAELVPNLATSSQGNTRSDDTATVGATTSATTVGAVTHELSPETLEYEARESALLAVEFEDDTVATASASAALLEELGLGTETLNASDERVTWGDVYLIVEDSSPDQVLLEKTSAGEWIAVSTEAAIEDTDSAPAEPDPTDEPEGFLSVEFEDEFDGVLGEGWSWIVEDPDEWSLEAAPGWLQLTATEVEHNILVRDAPTGAFEFTTAVRFRPTSNFQFAGLIVGPDQRLEDTFLQLGRAYCDPALAPDFCVGDGVYVDNLENGEFVGTASVAEITTDADVVHLRIVADGYSYQGYVSDDGETWELVGQHARRFGDAQIGLVNHQAFEAPAVAEFSYFTVTSPPTDDPPRDADTPIDAMTTTAVTTGSATLDQAVTGQPDAAVELGWEVEVTMADGSIRMIPVDEDTMVEIWPDGVTAGGVRVTIEVVEGEERITGRAA